MDSFVANVVLSLNALKVFIEQPTNLIATAQTWESVQVPKYNKVFNWNNASGNCPFLVSAGEGVQVSNKQITETSGLFSNLEPGDL